MSRKKRSWNDKKYLRKLLIHQLGIEERYIPERFIKLGIKINSLQSELLCYQFIASAHATQSVLYEFIKELRETV